MIHAAVGTLIWLLGLCVGSFLNVVVYRLPRGLSVNQPRRSFCPACERPIAWYDNIPVVSWLLLRARCRECRQAISVQYPLIEAVTGVAFVLVYHLLVVREARVGVTDATWHDAALIASWLTLAAVMIVCAAMDLFSYMIDVRVTNVCVAAGIVLHVLWPMSAGTGGFVETGRSTLAAAAAAAFLVGILMLALTVWREPEPEPEQDDPAAADEERVGSEAPRSLVAAAGWLGVLTLAAVWLLAAPLLSGEATAGLQFLAVPVALLVIFAVTVIAGGQEREADQEIQDAIEEESPHARRVVLAELLWLTPSILAAAGVLLLFHYVPNTADAWSEAAGWQIGATASGTESTPGGTRALTPLAGAAYAILGAVVAAAAGWVLRIFFTLALGREAFGVGDIYILAAAGAAAGWDIALLGLLFSVFLALAGWMVSLLLKRTGMIPFGPWLGLGFVAALWLNRPAHQLAGKQWQTLVAVWETRPDTIYILGGVMLVGLAGALGLARVMRILLDRNKPRPGFCRCGYDLTGNVSGRCPECGEAVR